MNRKLKVGFLFLVMIVLSVIFCPVAFGSSEHSLNAQEDEILYFQTIKASEWGLSLYWLMNISAPSGQAEIYNIKSAVYFASPPLAQDFKFQTINTTIYHEEVPSDRGEFTLYVGEGFIGTDNLMHTVKWNWKTLTSGSKVDTVLIDFNTKLLEGERLYAEIYILDTYNLGLNTYWGNSTYPSQVSYEGNAIYIPEFPSLVLTPLFMLLMLLTVIAYRRKLLKNETSPLV